MPSSTVCNVCDQPGTLQDALETQVVPCNISAFRNASFTVWRCRGCRSVHCADDVDLEFYYSEYPAHRINSAEPATDIACKSKLSVLTREGVTRQHSILDYGCGGGLFVRHLHARGYGQSYGYDPYVEDYSDSNLLSAVYDVVVTWDVIEHVDEPRELLRTLTGSLKPGGLLLIGTPNADRLSLSAPNPLHVPELHQPYHRHILSDRALKELARKQGLTLSSQTNRWYLDTLYPFVNTRFLWAYVASRGGHLDALSDFAPTGQGQLLRSPSLLFRAFFGYFLDTTSNMIVTFRRSA